MIAQLSAVATAVILAASSTASSCAAKDVPDRPAQGKSTSQQAKKSQPHGQSGQGDVVVEKSLCTIVLHRNGDKDWFCEPVDPNHPDRYPRPKLRAGDRIVGHGEAG